MVSPYRIKIVVRKAAPFQPNVFHCCINGCCLFNKESEKRCLFCQERRFEKDGVAPRRVHYQLPMGPQLAYFVQSKLMREKLLIAR